jgi:DNA-binding MarR family transcriptional regulator
MTKEPTRTLHIPPKLDDHLCLALYSANLAVQRVYKPVLDSLGVTYPQYLALNLLWERDTRLVGEMAAALDLEASTMTPILKRLEGIGLIERRRNPKNEREVQITLTKKGKDLRSEAGCVAQALQNSSGYAVEDILKLNAAVRDLTRAIKN